MPDINGIPYVESSDLVSAYPAASQALAQEVSDQLASKLPYSYGTATPSTTDSGFLWYDSNSTPAVAKYWDGSSFATLAPAPGLLNLDTQTFSATSSLIINNVFTTAYDSYSLQFFATISTSTQLALRYRASGTNTTTNYVRQRITAISSSVSSTASTDDRVNLGENGTTVWGTLMIYQPAVAANTYSQVVSGTDQTAVSIYAARQNSSTIFDGFELYPLSGTMTGKIILSAVTE